MRIKSRISRGLRKYFWLVACLIPMKKRFERLASLPARSEGLARLVKRSRSRWVRARGQLRGRRIRLRPPVLPGRAAAQRRNRSGLHLSLFLRQVTRPSAVNFFYRVIARRSNNSSRKTHSICCENDCSPSYRRCLVAKKRCRDKTMPDKPGIAAVATQMIDSLPDTSQ